MKQFRSINFLELALDLLDVYIQALSLSLTHART